MHLLCEKVRSAKKDIDAPIGLADRRFSRPARHGQRALDKSDANSRQISGIIGTPDKMVLSHLRFFCAEGGRPCGRAFPR